jgi:hypothetical protein
VYCSPAFMKVRITHRSKDRLWERVPEGGQPVKGDDESSSSEWEPRKEPRPAAPAITASTATATATAIHTCGRSEMIRINAGRGGGTCERTRGRFHHGSEEECSPPSSSYVPNKLMLRHNLQHRTTRETTRNGRRGSLPINSFSFTLLSHAHHHRGLWVKVLA